MDADDIYSDIQGSRGHENHAYMYSQNEESVTPVQANDSAKATTKVTKLAVIIGICVAVFVSILLIILVVLVSKSSPKPIEESTSTTVSLSTAAVAPTKKASKHTNLLPINFINIWKDQVVDNSGFLKYSYMCHSDKPSQDEFMNFNWKISDNLLSAQTANDFTSNGQKYTVILQKTATKYLCCFVLQITMFTKCTKVKSEPKTTTSVPIVVTTMPPPAPATTPKPMLTTRIPARTTPARTTPARTTPDRTTPRSYLPTTAAKHMPIKFLNIWLDSIQDGTKFNYGFVKFTFICHSDNPSQDNNIVFNWKMSDNLTVAKTPNDFTSIGQKYTVIIQRISTKYICCFVQIQKKTRSSCIQAAPETVKLTGIIVFTTQGRKGRTGVIQEAKVYETGCYQLELHGAAGGNYYNNYQGGRGARVITKEKLYRNTVLKIVVGQQGRNSTSSSYGAGGGGGSFVYTSNNELLAAAGGGGGAGRNSANNHGNGNGQTTLNGAANQCSSLGMSGGSNGYGGGQGTSYGSYRAGSGAGWRSKGNNGYCYSYGSPGGETRSSSSSSWSGGQNTLSSARSYTNGGFGGGGSGGCYFSSSYAMGGGGGGYSGGNGGQHSYSCSSKQGGGGGGSYCRTAASCTKMTGRNSTQSDGLVVITALVNC